MTTPADQFAASALRTREAGSALTQFRAEMPFELDDFQLVACRVLEGGSSVLVAAPTGSGKTVVGEFALHLALTRGKRAFYTTPIKALSNQKYRDLSDRYGKANVGLLTGDTVINGDASIVVMTTEVLRNMLYEGSTAIDELSHVVMDEVHYLADRQRGAVWEEVILHLPERVKLAALSATVSNAEEFGAWLSQVRGDTEIVVEERRPIPLHQHVLTGRTLVDLFATDNFAGDAELAGEFNAGSELTVSTDVNPVLLRMAQDDARAAKLGRAPSGPRGRGGRGGGRGGAGRSAGGPRRGGYIPRAAMLHQLDRAGLLPALVFVFSRRGCGEAVDQCVSAGVRLNDEPERKRVRAYVDARCADVPPDDLSVLGFYEWRDALERGVAAHHAGMLPIFKETVEELFSQGLIKAVFATETLALGINMPARSVVLERMVKWNGSTHADITPGEYTQLTGRAGRRGIDVEGHAVTVWHSGLDPKNLAGLASTRTYPLKSSFRPSYNMAVNLVGRMGRNSARELLETSFAQFQADAGVVGLANQIRKHEQALAGYAESMECHLGDFSEYAALRQQVADSEKAQSRDGAARRRASAQRELAALKLGDIIVLATGRRAGPALVVEQSSALGEDARPGVLTLDRRVKRISAVDVPNGVETISRMKVPRNFNSRSANWRRDLARALGEHSANLEIRRPRRSGNATEEADEQIAGLRAQLRAHPCHGCSDREAHARWAQRYHRLEGETVALRRRVESRTNTVARQFDRVCAMLSELGYLASKDGRTIVTDEGRMLSRLYSDQDLLAAECLRSRVWTGLDGPELAGACAALVYESRAPDDSSLPPRLPPSPALRAALAEQEEIADELAERESRHHLSFVREPNAGFSSAAWGWASGKPLHTVLRDNELAPGDFVRWCRQLLDLLAQIAETTDEPGVRRAAHSAAEELRRGVVAYTSVV